MLDLLDSPSQDSHNVWIATNFQVKAVSPEAATEYAQRWLADLLDRCTAPRGCGCVVSCSAVTFDDVTALALQLLDMEKQGGATGEIITYLRAEAARDRQDEAADPMLHLQAKICQQMNQQNQTTTEAPLAETPPGKSD